MKRQSNSAVYPEFMSDKDEQDEMPRGSGSFMSAPATIDDDRMPGAAVRARTSGPGAIAKLPETIFHGFDSLFLRLLGDYAPMLRCNKPLLFAVAGFLGAAAGALVAEFVPHFRFSSARLGEAVYTAFYSGFAAGGLTIALALAGEYYLRRLELAWRAVITPLLSGAVAGAIAGGIGGFLYGADSVVEYWREVLFRPACWAIIGALVGARLVKVSPNLGFARAIGGGAIGGALGGVAFLFTAILFPQFLGRIVGFGVMGAALGLALTAANAVFRSAELEVIWARNETTRIPLGNRPVYIGGGDDHVPIAGLPEHAIALTFEDGKIRSLEKGSGRKSDLKDGSRIKIGRVELLIHAKKAPAKPVEF